MTVREKVGYTVFLAWFGGLIPLIVLAATFSHRAAAVVGLAWGIVSMGGLVVAVLRLVWTS